MSNLTTDHDRPSGRTLREYWTTGTISALCKGISGISGFIVELHDELGRILDSNSLENQHIEPPKNIEHDSVFPIKVNQEYIGAIVVREDPCESEHTCCLVKDHEQRSELVRTIAENLAQTVTEICINMTQLRNRVDEVGVLYKLSSLLAQGGRVKDMLGLTLDLALEVLELDAGAIMLLPENAPGIAQDDLENELERSASVGLGEQWLRNPVPLSINREFDQGCLQGDVVTSEHLSKDSRVLVPEQCEEEGLIGFLGAGMVFNDRPIGVIRLYSRTPRVFSSADRDLIRSIGESAAAAVEQARLLKLQARQRRTDRSLRIAGAVQKRMLPDEMPVFEQFELAAKYRPSQEIGGDFYDLFLVRDQLGVLVGDVVGKGVVAGLLMSAVRATIRAYAELSDDVARVMVRTNDAVVRDTTVSEFVTIWYGMIDPESLTLNYVNAGHEPPMVLRKVDNQWEIIPLEGSGLVVGVLADEQYSMHSFDLQPGDFVIAYTDGITDAINFDLQRFRKQRLEESIIEHLNDSTNSSAQDLLERVFWSLRQFGGLQDQADDETLVVIRVQ